MLAAELTNNPFVAPEGGRCVIDQLPSELLSHIFNLGWAPERDEEDDEEDFEDMDEGASDEGSCSSSSSASGGSDEDANSRKLPFNVLVSHVCERWRAVALSNPLLWNHVSFVGPPPYDRALIYLARAGTVPLALTIDRTVDSDDSDSEEEWSESDYNVTEDKGQDNDRDLSVITGIMHTVVPHIAHTHALQIMVSFYSHMHRALEMLGACPGAPLLEVLQLYHYEETDEHAAFPLPALRAHPFVLFGGHAPCLAEVALWGVHVDWSRAGAPYLAGLTDLELAYHARDVRPSFNDFVRILRASPGLRTLTLCLSGPAGTPDDWPDGLPADGPAAQDLECDLDGHGNRHASENAAGASTDADLRAPLVLPALKELLLAYLEPAYLLALLQRLSLPALSSLALDLEDDNYSDVLRYLATPGAGQGGRSLFGALTALKLASLNCDETLVADAYAQLGNLVALNLNTLYLGEVWFDLLFPAPGRPGANARGGTGTGAGSNGPGNEANGNGVGKEKEKENGSGNGSGGAPLLLPRLAELTTTGVDGAEMRALVEARARAGAPLRRVLMNEDDAVDDAQEAWLRAHLERFELFEGSDEEDAELASADVDGVVWTSDDEWEDVDDDQEDEDDGEDEGSSDEDGPGGLDIVLMPL